MFPLRSFLYSCPKDVIAIETQCIVLTKCTTLYFLIFRTNSFSSVFSQNSTVLFTQGYNFINLTRRVIQMR